MLYLRYRLYSKIFEIFLADVSDLPTMDGGRRLVRPYEFYVCLCDLGLAPTGGICKKLGRGDR